MSDAGPLGILGGTFDPIHFGHLRLAEEARDALGLDKIRLIPAGQPPHREAPGSAAADRLAMTRLAITGLPRFEVDAAEVLSSAPSYTVPTLLRLRAEFGAQRPLVLLLGTDAFQHLASWHRWRELFTLAHIGIATRPGYALDADALPRELAAELHTRRITTPAGLAREAAGGIATFTMTPLAISATAIRADLRAGRSPRFLLPDAVLDYIQTHSLYSD